MIVGRWMRGAGAALMVLAVSACGDPDTPDNRGYTKAPLENPGVLVSGEQPSNISRYGSPNRVDAEELHLPEEVAVTEPEDGAAAVDLPEGVTQEMVTAGQAIFGGAGMCFACHGANGSGSPLAPTLNESTWLHIDGSFDAIIGIVNTGVPTPMEFPAAMLPRGGSAITDDQVREVAAYVYSISR